MNNQFQKPIENSTPKYALLNNESQISERNNYPQITAIDINNPQKNDKVYNQPNTLNSINNANYDSVKVNFSFSDGSQFKTSPVLTPCPNCKEVSFTRVNRKLSVNNVACCVVFNIMPWVLFQALRKKDINFYDGEHYCSKCNVLIAEYHAC